MRFDQTPKNKVVSVSLFSSFFQTSHVSRRVTRRSETCCRRRARQRITSADLSLVLNDAASRTAGNGVSLSPPRQHHNKARPRKSL